MFHHCKNHIHVCEYACNHCTRNWNVLRIIAQLNMHVHCVTLNSVRVLCMA